MYNINLEGYLVVKRGRYGYTNASAKFVSKSPALASNEIAIKVNAKIPEQLFSRPQLKFNIVVPEDSVPQKEITAEVIGNVKELVEIGLGMEVQLISKSEK